MLIFNEDSAVATIICHHIVSGISEVAHVFHDSDDGMWQFFCHGKHDTSNAALVSLEEAIDLCHLTEDFLNRIPCGYSAHDCREYWEIVQQ